MAGCKADVGGSGGRSLVAIVIVAGLLIHS